MKKKPKTYFLVMRLSDWSSITVNGIKIPSKLDPDDGCVGFCTVYKTRKLAEKAWPESTILSMQVEP
jgi:hypothetical protein